MPLPSDIKSGFREPLHGGRVPMVEEAAGPLFNVVIGIVVCMGAPLQYASALKLERTRPPSFGTDSVRVQSGL
jgi:hypothetical protein